MRPADVGHALARLPDLVNGDPGLVRRGRALSTTFLLVSEHPERFRGYLLPVLDDIRGSRP